LRHQLQLKREKVLQMEIEEFEFPPDFPYLGIQRLRDYAKTHGILFMEINTTVDTTMRTGERGEDVYFYVSVEVLNPPHTRDEDSNALDIERPARVRITILKNGIDHFLYNIEDWGVGSEFMRVIDKACMEKYFELATRS
jgi:hypothetical protein